jgi:hypothetical protein
MNLRAFQCFAVGTHTDSRGLKGAFSAAEIDLTALVYDPVAHPAPLVLGHPQDNGPQFGKVLGLVSFAGTLCAIADVSDALVSAVRAGRYKKVSCSFHLPNSPVNPKRGAHYLKHIGFLGAAPPAVTGLAPLEFAAAPAFAAPYGSTLDLSRDQLYQPARDLRCCIPGLSFVQAAICAERALSPTRS